MRLCWYRGCFLPMLLVFVGCRSQVAGPVDVVPEDTTTHLGEKSEYSLADWLKRPRPELAKLVEEWTETVRKQQEAARGNPESVQLLPQLHPSKVSVVFAEARFSPSAGFSLPPYLKEGQTDAAVALHLARFGDREAALKLAAAEDQELRSKIDACQTERNYPVEWTRLVGLVLHNAQLRLANGEPEGAAELAGLHRQLRSVLDAKAAAGPLGAALLPVGRQALAQATAAWRQPRWNKTALAADIDAVLAEWGKTPDPVPAIPMGAKQSEIAELFNAQAEGRAVLARTPAAVQRSLDLLSLPLPTEGVESVVAFLDGKRELTELLVLYRPKINELFPEPRHLALSFIERDYPNETPASSAGLNRQTWTGGNLSYDVAVLTRGNASGAFIRIAPASTAQSVRARSADAPPLAARDFAAVNLDRSFEQNRLTVAPNQSGTLLQIKDQETLARIRQPAAQFAPELAVVQREAKANLVANLTLRWPIEQKDNALNRLVLPFFAAYGAARIESAEGSEGGGLILTWQDDTTRVKLRLPFGEQSPQLVAEDSRGAADLPKRIEAAERFDRRERQQRFAAGKPRTRLSRSLQPATQVIDALRLGMTREEARSAVTGSHLVRVVPMSDGLNVLFLTEPPASATYWPRQLFVRFGPDGRAAEIRSRYQEGPRPPGKGAPSLLDALEKKSHGVPETLPAPWAGLWTDLPAGKPPVLYRWRDDVTSLTYQRDEGGSEVVLRDCPAERPEGVALPPLSFCRRGVEACHLGDSRTELFKRWHITRPTLATNGAEVLALPAKFPYDAVLIQYDNDKVAHLIARHRQPKGLKPAEVGSSLQQAWAADFDRLGAIRRQDGRQGRVVQAYTWNDDRTRVRIFAQETEEGIRLFTEWREWPIPAKSVAAK